MILPLLVRKKNTENFVFGYCKIKHSLRKITNCVYSSKIYNIVNIGSGTISLM